MHRLTSHATATMMGAALLLGGAPYAAQAAATTDDATVMSDFFKGTLEIDVPAGGPWSAKSYLSPGHTFRSVGSDGESRGSWEVRDGKICTTADHAPTSPDRIQTYCNTGPGKHMGDKWRDNDPVTGNAVFFHLAPGRG
ncbi:hypothetical protein [Phenylobacterium sp.]|uniref:hypothetical protein n=1 Tax=Phenylobacterium sp. TaxID=1871053 RepID=UPI00286D0CB6|nr:hypothetical protein [Phenylobacterium sp.]